MDSIWSGNNAINAQLEFKNAKQALIDAGLDPNTINSSCLTMSYLRLETQLTTAANNYPLNVLANIQNNGVAVRPTEVRLNLQDAFYVAGITISIAKPAALTSTAFPLYSYPSPTVFATTGAAAAAYGLYNGYMSINVNNDIIITKYPLLNFLTVPQTQLTGTTNSPLDQFAGVDRLALQPNPVFVGQNNTVVTLHLPAALAVVETTQMVVVELYGVLAQNVSTLVAR